MARYGPRRCPALADLDGADIGSMGTEPGVACAGASSVPFYKACRSRAWSYYAPRSMDLILHAQWPNSTPFVLALRGGILRFRGRFGFGCAGESKGS